MVIGVRDGCDALFPGVEGPSKGHGSDQKLFKGRPEVGSRLLAVQPLKVAGPVAAKKR